MKPVMGKNQIQLLYEADTVSVSITLIGKGRYYSFCIYFAAFQRMVHTNSVLHIDLPSPMGFVIVIRKLDGMRFQNRVSRLTVSAYAASDEGPASERAAPQKGRAIERDCWAKC